jgi:enterochelin esterase family protein
MRKITFLFAVLFITIAVHAQQALWGGSQIVSPEINNDNTVTFRLLAPNAQTVQITGDFLPTRKMKTPYGDFDVPGTENLTKNDKGIWEFKSNILSSELYSYNFIVNGVKVLDPSNVYMNRDVNTVTNIFIIKGIPGDLYSVNNVKHGSVTRLWYYSQTVNKARRLTVYTPAGYNDGNKMYPVLYLLHGMGGDEEAWMALGRMSEVLDNLIAQGKAQPMIVVMTNGNITQDAAPGESALGLTQPNMQLPKTMNGEFEEAFPEVIKFIDSHFRTISDKADRAICGLSMGGFHSKFISAQYPDMFDYVGLFSAAMLPNNGVTSEVYKNADNKVKVQFSKKPKLYWIGIGKTDFLYKYNVEYRKFLDDNKFKYTYMETEGGHIWRNWRIYLTEFAQKLFK